MKKRLIALMMTVTVAASAVSSVYADDDIATQADEQTEATTEETTKETTTETTTEATTKETTTQTTTKETTTEATTKAATTTTTTTTTQSSNVSKTFTVSVTVGDTYNLAQKISVSAGDLDWSSADTSIATVTSAGKITAKKKGEVFINATGSVGSVSYDYYFDITVKKSSDDDDDDDDYDKSFTIYVDDTKNLYSYVDDDYSATSYTWKSKNKSIATVTSKGVVEGVKAGTAVIVATYDDEEYRFKITVKKSSSSSSTSSSSSSSSSVSTKTSWTLYLDEGDKLDLSQFMDEDPDDCDWDVDDDDIVSLDEDTGKIKALEEGSTTIEAEGDDDDYTFTIKVDDDYTTRTLSIKKGETKDFSSLLPNKVKNYSISSDRTSVAKLSGDSSVYGVANGTATIICKNGSEIVQIVVTVSGTATTTTTTTETTTETTTAATTKKVTTIETTTAKVNFTDISSRAWAVSAINNMVAKGFIVGRNASTFAPDDTCTRADFTIVLVKLLGLSVGNSGNYSDVEDGAYYYNYVSTAKNNGIEAGVANDKFRPTESITREEIMVMVYKGLVEAGVQMNIDQRCLSNYSDGDQITAEYRDAVAALINLGAVAGDSDTTISPKKNITRAQMAVLLNNVYSYVSK